MTNDTRDALVDLTLLGVAALAVWAVVRTPPLRRATWRLVKYGVFTAAPTWLWQETMRAWAESGTPNSARAMKPAIIDA